MDQCQHIKKGGERCRNNAVKGMRFCYLAAHCGTAPFSARLQSFFLSNWKVFILSTVVSIVIGGIYFAIQEDEVRHGALFGRLLGRKDTLKEPSIILGNARVGLLGANSNLFIDSDGSPLVSLHIDNKGYLKTSVKLRNSTGALVGEIVDNEWKLKAGEIFDRNFNDQVLEVRDSTGDVALQVVDYGDAVLLQGTLYCRSGTALQFQSMPTGLGRLTIIRPNSPPPPTQIKPICDYPSETHLGECPRALPLTKRQIQAFNFYASGGLDCPDYSRLDKK
jgi:hypothetical protein